MPLFPQSDKTVTWKVLQNCNLITFILLRSALALKVDEFELKGR